MARIVLLGPTGHTGRLIAELLAGQPDHEIVLAGRSRARLDALSAELDRACVPAVVDLAAPHTIAALLSPGDVLATTVGAFLRRGAAALTAAISAGAHYFDTTGEAPFVRRVFEDADARAARGVLVPAMGFNYAPGNLAGALALARSGGAADRVDIGYFLTGEAQGELSGGTLASATGVLLAPGFTRRDGELVSERCGARTRTFDVGGRRVPAMTLGSSEALTLPAGARTVDVYQGGLGRATPVAAQVSRLAAIPGAATGLTKLNELAFARASGGPPADVRARAGTHVTATAVGPEGHVTSEVVLRGPNVYDLTARLVAWAALEAAAGRVNGRGPTGPVDAFGLEPLQDGHRRAGMTEQDR